MEFLCTKAGDVIKTNGACKRVLGALLSSWGCKYTCPALNYSCAVIPAVRNKKKNRELG